MAYTKYARGSEWRKWDLHIHTPGTKKNDNFRGSTIDERWQNFIADINASTEEIAVIGITDYFSIDNYFKFKGFIEDGSITKKFDMVIPNIELRVLPVTGSATAINLHCIFNPLIDKEINTRFLSKLKFEYGESSYSAEPNELIRLGRALPGNSGLDEFAALKAGIGQYVIEVGSLREIFKNDKKLRDNTIIAVSNKSNDGMSGLTQHSDFFVDDGSGKSQLDGTRWGIYQFSDAIFSSNPKDILYFLGSGPDSKEIVLEKCSILMPCFHGCDAHDNGKIFTPDNNRYCWIKADPTFEGLKQTLYEPADRVKIQAYKPDIKNDRFLISELNFIDSGNLFGNQKILLNENLNSIIGGKSSGKSLLMYSAARSIDPAQVDRLSARLKFEGYKFDSGNFDFEVVWKNGETDKLSESDPNSKIHKITYIPQLYINHLVERNNKDDLNTLIESILLQDNEFKIFYEQKKEKIARATEEIDDLITQYLQTRAKALEIQQNSRETGKSESLQKSAESLQGAIAAGQKASNLNEDEFAEYTKLTEEKAQLLLKLKELDTKEQALERILLEVTNSKTDLLGDTQADDGIPLRGRIDKVLDQFNDIPNDIELIVQKLNTDFDALINGLKTEIDKIEIDRQKSEMSTAISTLDQKLKPYLDKIAGQQELQKLTGQLQNEQQKIQLAINLEKQLDTHVKDYKNIREKIVVLLKSRHEDYKSIAVKINETRKDIGTGITLTCSLLYNVADFQLYEQVNKASVPGDNIFYTLFEHGLVKYDEVIKLFNNPLRESDNKLGLIDGSINIPLKGRVTLEEILRGMVVDAFKLDFTVSYKGDDLLSMSPGKKGTVLLILFLQISSAEYPIFIDQPEDNLDNRTIYDLLCYMIKIKKKDRQIVIVSHNANLVIATDSENIIVANQEGQDSTASSKNRFQYVNGSIEHTFPKDTKIPEILHQQGIKEHACDILEGGDEAFKQRERKYSIK